MTATTRPRASRQLPPPKLQPEQRGLPAAGGAVLRAGRGRHLLRHEAAALQPRPAPNQHQPRDWAGLALVPACWAALQPLLCAVFHPKVVFLFTEVGGYIEGYIF